MPEPFKNGVAVAAVNYTLRPTATLNQIVSEIRRSISWLYYNCQDYGCNPDRIYIAGSSAGGHLAGMLVSGGWQKEFSVPEDVIKGAMLLSGLYDLEPVALSFANKWMELNTADVNRNSPIHLLPNRGCPLIISYGGSETSEFKRQSNDYASKWQAAGFNADCFERMEQNHFDIPLELAETGSVLTKKMLGLIS